MGVDRVVARSKDQREKTTIDYPIPVLLYSVLYLMRLGMSNS